MTEGLRSARSWTMAAAALLTLTTAAQAAPVANPDKAAIGLSRLSAADLDTATPKGKAYLVSLFRNPAKDCSPPSQGQPDFDRLCYWSSDPEATWPDLMIGIMGTKIVSVATAYEKLDPKIWSCRAADDSNDLDSIKLCHVRTISAATQQAWSDSWRSFLNSVN